MFNHTLFNLTFFVYFHFPTFQDWRGLEKAADLDGWITWNLTLREGIFLLKNNCWSLNFIQSGVIGNNISIIWIWIVCGRQSAHPQYIDGCRSRLDGAENIFFFKLWNAKLEISNAWSWSNAHRCGDRVNVWVL
jgi:hypothetical protein